MPKKKRAGGKDLALLTLLKQPPILALDKVLIDCIQERDAWENSVGWVNFGHLVRTLGFIASIKKCYEVNKDRNISDRVTTTKGIPTITVPKELIRDLRSYLHGLTATNDKGQRPDSKKILTLLPYWPWVLNVIELTEARAVEVARSFNKKRWANTLRYLTANDCPLDDNTKKVAIAQYRIVLAVTDEFKNLPRVIASVKRQLGLPKSPREGREGIVENLVAYLSPFYPIKVRRKNTLQAYSYERLGERPGSKAAVSKRILQMCANILRLAYPHYWPTASSSRVRNYYHSS